MMTVRLCRWSVIVLRLLCGPMRVIGPVIEVVEKRQCVEAEEPRYPRDPGRSLPRTVGSEPLDHDAAIVVQLAPGCRPEAVVAES